jgi:hypothetical protein
MSADYILWVSNSKMTCGVIVEHLDRDLEGNPIKEPMQMIRQTPPILRKFRGEDVQTLKNWLLKTWPETKFEVRPSPTQGGDAE